MCLGVGQTANTVLHNDDCTIDDDPEVKSAEAHQVGTNLVGHHPRKGKQHGERDHHGGDYSRPHVAEEQEQNDDDQDRPFQKVLLDGIDRFVHKDGAVIDCHCLDAFRQIAVDFDHFLVDRS